MRAIEIRSETPLDDLDEVASLVTLAVGKPLEDADVRRTLRNLQALGVGQEIELYTVEEPGGTVAVLVIRPGVMVGEIRLEGELGLRRDELLAALPQRAGRPLSEESVVRGVFNLLAAYEDMGYFTAGARVAVRPLSGRDVAVVYTVAAGPRASVGAVGFAGTIAPFAPATLARQIRSRPGTPFSRSVARADAERLAQWLNGERYGTARVDPPALAYDAASNTVALTFTTFVGPEIRLTVTGASERELEKKGLLPFFGDVGYDEALVLETVNRIRAYYQRQGHYRVQVDADESRAEGVLSLQLAIVPGPRYTLEEVRFAGNEAFSGDELADLLATAPRRLTRAGSGRLVDRVLSEDLANLRRFYALQGFAEVRVDEPRVEETKPGELLLTVTVREGAQRRLASLTLVGVEALEDDNLAARLPLEEGGPFHPILLDNTLSMVRGAFAERGYTEARVSARQTWNADRTVVDLTVTAEPGVRQLVDRLIVRGNHRTESAVIRRTARLAPGEPVSQTRLLEIERDLYRLGIFSGVDVELSRPGLGTSDRDVLIRVEEGRPRRLTYGLGWDSEDGPRGLLGFSHNNVGGKAYSLQTDVRLSGRENRFRFVFSQPTLARRPVTLTSTAFFEDEARRDKPFEVTRYGARVEAVRVYGSRRLSLGLDYRTVELVVEPGVASNEIERQNQPYQLTSFVPTLFWDRRNDPIVPTRGSSSLVQVQYAFPAFATDAELLKLFVHQTHYLPLGRSGVVAASLRLGGIEPFSELAVAPDDPLADLPSHNVPIAERFFAGGDATHRAYGRDELGIRGETLLELPGGSFLPVGGDGLLVANLEWRFPLISSFEGTLFYDLGNVWADWRDINAGELKQGIGLGLRYLSPIGPIRAGVGWKLDREPGESRYEFFLNVGNPF